MHPLLAYGATSVSVVLIFAKWFKINIFGYFQISAYFAPIWSCQSEVLAVQASLLHVIVLAPSCDTIFKPQISRYPKISEYWNILIFSAFVAPSLSCQSGVPASGRSAPYMHQTCHSYRQTAVTAAHVSHILYHNILRFYDIWYILVRHISVLHIRTRLAHQRHSYRQTAAISQHINYCM